MIRKLLGLLGCLVLTVACMAETAPELQTPILGESPPVQPRPTQATQPLPQPSPTPAVTATPPPPPPTPTLLPDSAPIVLSSPAPLPPGEPGATAVNAIQEPLLIDGEQGWIVAQAQVNAEPKSVILSTSDGRLLRTFDVVGKMALDRNRQHIIVDTGVSGLAVLDGQSGLELARIDLPTAAEYAAPQVAPDTGLIYAFRQQNVYVIDPVRLGNLQTYETTVQSSICNAPGDFAPVARSDYDLINHRLYLTFVSYVCTPWSEMTMVAYDVPDAGAELSETGRLKVAPGYQALAFLDNLYGITVSRLGPTTFWAWGRGEQPWFLESLEYGGEAAGIVADWGRQLIYESIGSRVRIVDPLTRRAVHEVEIPLLGEGGRLAGHDPVSDQVYLLTASGQLQPFAAGLLTEQAIIVPPEAETQRETAVTSLVVSPSWVLDQSMAGLWDNGDCPGDGGLLFVLRPDRGWFRSAVSEAGACDAIGAVALTPIFGATGEMFAASNNTGAVYKSADFGRTWQPVGQPLLQNASFRQLLVSPAYGLSGERVLFAHASSGTLFRSVDDGQNWQALDILLDQLAMSAEFDEDGSLLGAAGTSLFISHDRGDSWQQPGNTPGDEPLAMLSIAPLFRRWQTLFAFSTGGNFYRSLDSGLTWELVISTSPAAGVQIAYGANMEANRPIFLLHGGMLDASYDGWNSPWAAPMLPPTVSAPATALAISPNFAEDGRLFVGTADGQVISLDASLE